ncbi:hypothetical protein [Cohnella candidum]|uniref:Nucleotidyltransferase family protein n=1 Tax=Cohnella candidum TaxID=2674991 RepID=A0A3G3JWW3_9BACL|nr:hypothetical protein [Cohnella candidum]AYQ72733.1 hypothetical protein EAV92_09260 [Cohnella candidum]
MDSLYPADAVADLAGRLSGIGAVWVVGGSTGLAMRGADIGRAPRDLDLYADEADAARIHRALAASAVDEPAWSSTERYRSMLSHYTVAGTPVELVGEFRIETGGSLYRTEVASVLYPEGDSIAAGPHAVRLVPLGHELIFNVLRDRPDRCGLIGRLIREQPMLHMPALENLLKRNVLAPEAAKLVWRYATIAGEGEKGWEP